MNFNTSTGRNIPWQGANKKFVSTLFELVLHPMEEQGVDFWWLNYLFFSDMEKNRDTRPMLYHRWGGLGNHRYQIGFSGDAFVTWASLAFQPYFTSTASNVLYSYWSHDLGGHMLLRGNLDPEIYVRWIQYGVFSPIFRTHSAKDARLNKEIWKYSGEYFDALCNSIYLRYQLVPYIYTMARKTYDDAIGLCRPMYYEYPDAKEAYDYTSQYMFGDNMIISPVISAREGKYSTVKVWLPKGKYWYEWQTGTMLKGGQEIVREFPLDEYPVYLEAGSIIPMYNDNVKNLQEIVTDITLGVFPGESGIFRLYEDAGDDKNYDKNYAITTIRSKVANRVQQIEIDALEGKYEGMPLKRNYYVKIYGAEMPQSVSVNGKKINYTTIENDSEWSYSGSDFSVIIPVPNADVLKKTVVNVEYDKNRYVDVNTGLVRQMKELSDRYLEYKSQNNAFPGWVVPEVVGQCEETNRKLEYFPEKFYENIHYFISNYETAYKMIEPNK